MNKKVLKAISILVLAALILFTFAMPTFAAKVADPLDPSQIKANDTTDATFAISKIAGAILSMVQMVAISVAVIMLIVLAIKYISAAPNDKAEIKKHAVVYIIGAVVLFSASGIIAIIKQFAGNITDATK